MNKLNWFAAVFFLLLGLSPLHAYEVHDNKFSTSFWTPLYHKLPVAYCLREGGGCGKLVADRYCRWMGYDKSTHIRQAFNLGYTRFLDSGTSCRHWQCSGFKTIVCVGHKHPHHSVGYLFRKKRFAFPRYMGHRVDWCADGIHGCGHATAYSFCRRLGYTKTIGFVKECDVESTKAIQNQKLCVEGCTGFRYIDCYR